MPEYLHPGVYIEETSYRGKPIQGVSTSTAGFVGAARKGPEGKPYFIPSFAHFRRAFGDPFEVPSGLGDYLGHSVRSFFENGGARCYVVRALAGDAQDADVTIGQGTVLRLAPGVTVRGPTRTLRLNALRGVQAGSVLRIFTRDDATSPFAQTRTATVESYDAVRGSVVVTAAGEIPGGVALEPANTYVLIQGLDPTAGGPTFHARNRGEDGNTLAVEVRPRDRPAVALATASAARQNPLIDLMPGDLANGQANLSFTPAALRRMRVGDRISIGDGADNERVVQAIAAGDIAFTTPAASDFSGGATLSLIERGGPLDTPIELGAAPPAFEVDMTAGGPIGPSAIPHDLAAFLRPGDVLLVDDGGGNTTEATIDAVQVAEEIAPGQHVTLASGIAQAETAPIEARIVATAAPGNMPTRLFVGSASRFAAPQRAGSPEGAGVSDGANVVDGEIMLVDPADNLLYFDPNGGPVPAGWISVEALQVVADGQTTIAVATTAGFYTGGTVELDSGTQKFEAVVQSVDPAARTVTLSTGVPLGPNNFIELPSAAAERRAYLRTAEIDLLVYENNVLKETFEGLTWNPDQATAAGLRYFVARLNDAETGSKLVTVDAVGGQGLTLAEAPVTSNGLAASLANGSNGSALTDIDLIGSDNGPGRRTGIQALAERDDISMVAVPGVTAETVQGQLIAHCELLKYRMAVLDCPLNATDVTALQAHRNNYDSKYAAYYAPWLRALNLSTGRIESFPPSPYAMGIYARSDNTIGVHKAPANEVVRNVVDVALPFTAAEQDVLNPVGINLIRDLTPRGIRVWGARTISSDQEWKYVNFRRLFIYLEHSIDLGTQWVVFEPNSESLWQRVVETITPFLIGVWKSGALMGTTPEEAFFVTCDRTTMTQDDIDNGRLVCEIGVAPVAPAEFVIFRIGQFTASTDA